MQVVRKDVSPLLYQINITIEPADYVEKYENGLKKYKNQAQIKGFRKGMVPMNTLKKMYGKSLLADTVYDVLNTLFNEYLQENKINTLGSPLPSEDQEPELNFDINHYNSFSFKFDVGVIPDFTISGVTDQDIYDYDEVDIDEESMNENIQEFLKRYGKQVEVEGEIEDNDILEIHAEELDENSSVKKDGWKTEFTVMVNTIIDKEVRKNLINKNIGHTFTFDITKLEKPDKEFIDKYLLNRTEADKEVEIGDMFTGKVHKIKRQALAEMTETFFEELGDEKIKSEQDLRDQIHSELKDSYTKNANSLLERKIFEKIKKDTNLEISRAFYKRLLEMNEKNKEVDIDDESLDKALEGTKWMIIKEDLLAKHEITVNEGEVKNYFFNQVMSYFRYYPNMDYSVMFDFVEKQMKNKNSVERAEDEIKVSKLFASISKIVQKNPISISSSDFRKKIDSMPQPE
ncbi:MAG: trigger factor [Saprospiraceae bacterium]